MKKNYKILKFWILLGFKKSTIIIYIFLNYIIFFTLYVNILIVYINIFDNYDCNRDLKNFMFRYNMYDNYACNTDPLTSQYLTYLFWRGEVPCATRTGDSPIFFLRVCRSCPDTHFWLLYYGSYTIVECLLKHSCEAWATLGQEIQKVWSVASDRVLTLIAPWEQELT